MEKQIALIGCGAWGSNILRVLKEQGFLHSACDLDGMVRSANNVTWLTFEEILASQEIKAVVIATPMASHFVLAERALLVGKDVLVEKPICRYLPEAEALERTARECGRILMVGHIMRYHPALEKLVEAAGEIGHIRTICTTRLNKARAYRQAGSALVTLGPHDVSLALSIVQCAALTVDAIGTKELVALSVTFEGGTHLMSTLSCAYPFKTHSVLVSGDDGCALWVLPNPYKVLVFKNGQGREIAVSQMEPLAIELAHFASCIQTRQKPKTDGREGVEVMRIIAEAEEKLWW